MNIESHLKFAYMQSKVNSKLHGDNREHRGKNL